MGRKLRLVTTTAAVHFYGNIIEREAGRQGMCMLCCSAPQWPWVVSTAEHRQGVIHEDKDYKEVAGEGVTKWESSAIYTLIFYAVSQQSQATNPTILAVWIIYLSLLFCLTFFALVFPLRAQLVFRQRRLYDEGDHERSSKRPSPTTRNGR